MYEFLGWVLFGLVVGVIAKLFMPGKDPGGFIITILIGVAGAVLGGLAASAMNMQQPTPAAAWVLSILGAILLLVIYRLVTRGHRGPTTLP